MPGIVPTTGEIVMSRADVLVCSGCHSKVTMGEGSLNNKCFLTVLEAGSPKSRCWGTFLVVQWLRVHLPMQGMRV